MAAREIQRRIFSLLSTTTRQPHTFLSKAYGPSANSFFTRNKNESIFCRFQTTSSEIVKNEVGPTQDNVVTPGPTPSPTPGPTTGKLKMSSRHDLAMVFTCKVCETRSVKTICRESYDKGVVVAKCSGCNNLHLISDRLGWFGEPSNVEEFLAQRGEEVKKGDMDTFNLTLEDVIGKEKEIA